MAVLTLLSLLGLMCLSLLLALSKLTSVIPAQAGSRARTPGGRCRLEGDRGLGMLGGD